MDLHIFRIHAQKLFTIEHSSSSTVAQSCLTLWPHEMKAPGSSIHGIPHASILEWAAISFSNHWAYLARNLLRKCSQALVVGTQIISFLYGDAIVKVCWVLLLEAHISNYSSLQIPDVPIHLQPHILPDALGGACVDVSSPAAIIM